MSTEEPTIDPAIDSSNSDELGEEEYEVEKILAHRKRKGKNQVLEYLIRWKGYESDEDTWESEYNIMAPLLLEEYWSGKGGPEAREAARLGRSESRRRRARRKSSSSGSQLTAGETHSTPTLQNTNTTLTVVSGVQHDNDQATLEKVSLPETTLEHTENDHFETQMDRDTEEPNEIMETSNPPPVTTNTSDTTHPENKSPTHVPSPSELSIFDHQKRLGKRKATPPVVIPAPTLETDVHYLTSTKRISLTISDNSEMASIDTFQPKTQCQDHGNILQHDLLDVPAVSSSPKASPLSGETTETADTAVGIEAPDNDKITPIMHTVDGVECEDGRTLNDQLITTTSTVNYMEEQESEWPGKEDAAGITATAIVGDIDKDNGLPNTEGMNVTSTNAEDTETTESDTQSHGQLASAMETTDTLETDHSKVQTLEESTKPMEVVGSVEEESRAPQSNNETAMAVEITGDLEKEDESQICEDITKTTQNDDDMEKDEGELLRHDEKTGVTETAYDSEKEEGELPSQDEPVQVTESIDNTGMEEGELFNHEDLAEVTKDVDDRETDGELLCLEEVASTTAMDDHMEKEDGELDDNEVAITTATVDKTEGSDDPFRGVNSYMYSMGDMEIDTNGMNDIDDGSDMEVDNGTESEASLDVETLQAAVTENRLDRNKSNDASQPTTPVGLSESIQPDGLLKDNTTLSIEPAQSAEPFQSDETADQRLVLNDEQQKPESENNCVQETPPATSLTGISDPLGETIQNNSARETATATESVVDTPFMTLFPFHPRNERLDETDKDRFHGSKPLKTNALVETTNATPLIDPITTPTDVSTEKDSNRHERTISPVPAHNGQVFNPSEYFRDKITSKKVTELSSKDVIFDARYPPDPNINWEEQVDRVELVTRDPHGESSIKQNYAVIRWHDGILSMHPTDLLRQKCPVKLIEFYENRLKFV